MTTETNITADTSTDQTNSPEFVIQKLFIKNMSIEAFRRPFVEQDKQIKFTLNVDTKSEKINAADGLYEVSLQLTLTAALDDNNLFFAKLNQAGLFSLKKFSEEQLGYMLDAYCPNVLFPYARRAIYDMTLHAGFPEIHLAPINFDAMHQQKMQNATAETKH